MQNRYTAPAASAGVPPRPSGISDSAFFSTSGRTPTRICRPATSMVPPASAGVSVNRVMISPKATAFTFTL